MVENYVDEVIPDVTLFKDTGRIAVEVGWHHSRDMVNDFSHPVTPGICEFPVCFCMQTLSIEPGFFERHFGAKAREEILIIGTADSVGKDLCLRSLAIVDIYDTNLMTIHNIIPVKRAQRPARHVVIW